LTKLSKAQSFNIGSKSLVVELEGDRIGQWHDFATGEGGDIFKLWGLVHGMSTNSGDFIKVVSSLSEHINGTSTAIRTYNKTHGIG
jgi:hypothetical protein